MFNFIPAYHLPLIILTLTGYVMFDHFDKPANINSAEVSMHRDLTEEEKHVLLEKGTEFPYTGDLLNNEEGGTYSCRNCGADLYHSDSKFDSWCGWPSFDDEIEGAVKRSLDPDGSRTEITCSNCGAHLGHVFFGERYTEKNTRHCVNSISLDFTPADWEPKKAVFAGGCFWGVEYYMEQIPGVESVVSGYTGGKTRHPFYELVYTGITGHIEAVEITYNPYKVTYRELAKRFFEIHDPTQVNGQGPDIGEQYKSVIFYNDEKEKNVSEDLITQLRKNGYNVATELRKASEFWPAEGRHQDYYTQKGSLPYCHSYKSRFSVEEPVRLTEIPSPSRLEGQTAGN